MKVKVNVGNTAIYMHFAFQLKVAFLDLRANFVK